MLWGREKYFVPAGNWILITQLSSHSLSLHQLSYPSSYLEKNLHLPLCHMKYHISG
jgi:hypothetical protein